MSQTLKRFVDETPYNDFTIIDHAAGLPVDLKFGGNCVFQSREFAKNFPEATFIKCLDGIHYAILIRNDEGLFYYDPSILQLEPVNVEWVIKRQASIVVDAYPVVNGEYSKLLFSSDKENKFKIELFISNGHINELKAAWTYDIRMATNKLPPNGDLNIALQARKNSFILRTINEDGSVSKLLFYRSMNSIKVVRLGGNHETQKFETLSYNRNFCERTTLEIEAMAKRFGLQIDQLLSKFVKAGEIQDHLSMSF